MALTKYKLGNLIQQLNNRNTNLTFSEDSVRGISTGKAFIETKADLDGVSLTSYKIVKTGEFAYVEDTSRRGDKIAVAYNTSSSSFLVSSIYTVFYVDKSDLLLSDYLFIYFNRPEFDRFSRFNSWGSAREVFSWDDFCDIEINLPSLEVQQKYVDVYNSMLENQKCYERGLDDLKLVCDAYIDDIKRITTKRNVGSLFNEIENRNTDNSIQDVNGINITKQFMPTVADIFDVKLDKYKVVRKGQFAFSGMQTGRDECIRIALLNKEKPIIISPAYTVLELKENSILPEYIMMWFSRKEVDRLGWFYSDASIRTNLDMDRFYEIEIPIPDLEKQQSIVNIYNAFNMRKSINEQLKSQIKDLCPILVKGSIEEASRTQEA